jgi:hypothetical protein
MISVTVLEQPHPHVWELAPQCFQTEGGGRQDCQVQTDWGLTDRSMVLGGKRPSGSLQFSKRGCVYIGWDGHDFFEVGMYLVYPKLVSKSHVHSSYLVWL